MRHLSIVMAAAVFAAGLVLVVVRARRRTYCRRARMRARGARGLVGRTSRRDLLWALLPRGSRRDAGGSPRLHDRARRHHAGAAVVAARRFPRGTRTVIVRAAVAALVASVAVFAHVSTADASSRARLRRAGRRLARAWPRHARVTPRRPRSHGSRRGALHRSLVRHRRRRARCPRTTTATRLTTGASRTRSSRDCGATGSILSSRSTARRAGRTAAVRRTGLRRACSRSVVRAGGGVALSLDPVLDDLERAQSTRVAASDDSCDVCPDDPESGVRRDPGHDSRRTCRWRHDGPARRLGRRVAGLVDCRDGQAPRSARRVRTSPVSGQAAV